MKREGDAGDAQARRLGILCDAYTMATFHYGGQAVMEGVMMRGRTGYAVAVRAPGGAIAVRGEALSSAIYTSRIAKLPFVRGLVLLWETLSLGIKTLMYSAGVALAEEEEQLTQPMIWGTLAVSLTLSIGIFFVGPLLLVGLVDRFIESSLVSNLLEGVIRLSLFVGYIWGIGRMPDIKRFFLYHGAEHKTINAYEDGVPLQVESIERYSTSHRRCGTSFLLVVLVLSILVFSLLGRPDMLMRIASRILLVPVIASVAYELIKLSANHPDNLILRGLLWPGMQLQKLTTGEPDAGQIEVAIAALSEVLVADGVIQREQSPSPASGGGLATASLD
jgi:uncharacterized protein YqhQ